MTKLLIPIAFLFLSFSLSSQELIQHQIGKGESLYGFQKIDSFYYQLGTFDDEVTVGFNNESQVVTEIGNGITNQIYVVKYDLDFNIVWASAVKFTNRVSNVQMKYKDGFLYLLWVHAGSGILVHYCHRINIDDPLEVGLVLRFESSYGLANTTFEISDAGAIAVAGTYTNSVKFTLGGVIDKEYFCNSDQNIFLVHYGFQSDGLDFSHIVQREWGNPGDNERNLYAIKFDGEENIHLFGVGNGSVQLDNNSGPAIGNGALFQVSYSKSDELIQFKETDLFFPYPPIIIPVENNNYAFVGGRDHFVVDENMDLISSKNIELNWNQKVIDVASTEDSYTALYEFRPSDNELSLGGYNFKTNFTDYALIHYDFEGNMNWYSYFGGDGYWDQAYSVDYLENGNLLVCGNTDSSIDLDPSHRVVKYNYEANKFFIAEYSTVCNGLSTGIKNISHITCNENAHLEFGINGGTSPYQFYFDNQLVTNYEDIEVSEIGIYEAYVIDEEACSKSVFVPVTGPSLDPNEKLNLHQHTAEFRTGFETNIFYSLDNMNCIPKSGIVKIVLDEQIAFIGASQTPLLIDGQTLEFDYGGLVYQDSIFKLNLDLKISEDATFGEYLCARIYIYDEQGAEIDRNILCNEVINSYDPNDISVSPYGRCDENFFLENEELEYTIRFQNLGNAEAINIEIVDTLSTALDINSFVQTGTSHNAKVFIEEDSILIIQYLNIYLPAEEQDEAASNGYFSYKIKTVQNLDINTKIDNKAAIFFDFNDPVVTNTVSSTIIDALPTCVLTKVHDFANNTHTFYPNPVLNTLTIEHDEFSNAHIELFDISGRQYGVTVTKSKTKTILDLSPLISGIYFVKIDSSVIRIFKE